MRGLRTGPDLPQLYAVMCRIRHLERATRTLWERGLVSGELHAGLGEEAVAAGVVAHLRDGDALALDYRGTPPLVARGIDPESLVLELLGSPDGLCGGRAGHMHLMSEPLRAAASGIVGAPGPLACGFGLAARRRGAGDVAVAFFGDGAVNEGMLLEALNLAAVWRLPVVFVCKDNRWAVTTRSGRLTGGGLRARARGLGLPVRRVDGGNVTAVWWSARRAVGRARRGAGPTFLIASCPRLAGHMAGDPLGRMAQALGALGRELPPLVAAVRTTPGAPLRHRLRALTGIGTRLALVSLDVRGSRRDPVRRAARRLPREDAVRLDELARGEVAAAVSAALAVRP
ncbi:MAG: thiamine pyrophosphate-dependent dehydrogenase E1 component subunit alpha [Blastococcus sp.]